MKDRKRKRSRSNSRERRRKGTERKLQKIQSQLDNLTNVLDQLVKTKEKEFQEKSTFLAVEKFSDNEQERAQDIVVERRSSKSMVIRPQKMRKKPKYIKIRPSTRKSYRC